MRKHGIGIDSSRLAAQLPVACLPEAICRRMGQFCNDHLSTDGARLAGASAIRKNPKEPDFFPNGRKCFRCNTDPGKQDAFLPLLLRQRSDLSGGIFGTGAAMCIITSFYTHNRRAMRTNIVIDDKLMADAIKASGAKTKKEAVELGLKALVRLKKQERIKGFRGKLRWQDDLDRMRTD